MVAYNNLAKSGVDMIVAATGVYSSQRKKFIWWKTTFYYILDLMIFNAFVIYYEQNLL